MITKTTNWPDLAIALYERLTEKNAEVKYEFCDFDLSVPSAANHTGDALQAKWRMNGVMKIRTRNKQDGTTNV